MAFWKALGLRVILPLPRPWIATDKVEEVHLSSQRTAWSERTELFTDIQSCFGSHYTSTWNPKGEETATSLGWPGWRCSSWRWAQAARRSDACGALWSMPGERCPGGSWSSCRYGAAARGAAGTWLLWASCESLPAGSRWWSLWQHCSRRRSIRAGSWSPLCTRWYRSPLCSRPRRGTPHSAWRMSEPRCSRCLCPGRRGCLGSLLERQTRGSPAGGGCGSDPRSGRRPPGQWASPEALGCVGQWAGFRAEETQVEGRKEGKLSSLSRLPVGLGWFRHGSASLWESL